MQIFLTQQNGMRNSILLKSMVLRYGRPEREANSSQARTHIIEPAIISSQLFSAESEQLVCYKKLDVSE